MPWSLILTIALQIIAWILKAIGVKQETHQAFLRFIELASNDSKSTRLAEFGEKQKAWFQKHPWPEGVTIEHPINPN